MSEMKNVLVVDDEPSIRALYQIAFSHSGYEVQVASSGEEALEILQNKVVQVIFLDLNLPGIKGDELCRKIVAKWPDIRMVAITGNIQSFGEEVCRDAGFNYILHKPIQLEDLLNATREN
ncbi:response regulator [Kiritimatiellota bacterium B12222]|nr:response regulator [Kiritimatiellota bacterium B12222]